MLLHVIRRKPTQSAHQCAGRAEYFAVGKIRKGEKAARLLELNNLERHNLWFFHCGKLMN